MIKKLRAGKFLIPVEITPEGNRLALQFKYNKKLLSEIKAMEGAKWHGFEEPYPRKIWTILNSPRNQFQLNYLAGDNPYAPWEGVIVRHDYVRDLYEHQKELCDFILSRHYCLLAAEMGVGKSRCIIEALKLSQPESCWWIAPKSALLSVEKELEKWGCSTQPRLLTYEKVVKIMKDWNSGGAPQFVIMDESSRVKNYTAQRSQAAMALANGVREDWKDTGYVVLMSGTPAPRSPVDWWFQSEITCPGFLKEGNVHKFKQRLAFIVERETFAGGGMYKHILSWRDNPKKCDFCGELESGHKDADHPFKKSINEVALLHRRLEGLVMVKFKKDCLDLPPKFYREIELKPTQKMLQVAKTIVDTSPTAIEGLIRLRELSDGFQYYEEKIGKEVCSVCRGNKRTVDPLDENETCICDGCGGLGTRPVYKRIAEQVETPKERALVDLLDEYSEVGRLVVYAAFTGSIDRVVEICKASGWNFIRMDGRGIESDIESDPLTNFQEKLEEFPKLVFIGQPSSSGYGLTLTASPAIVYFSNDYNVESRLQSEDRIHRIGCKGAMIIDLLHLPTDKLVLECIRKKKKLQSLTLGEIESVF